jgi:hypothetical protein
MPEQAHSCSVSQALSFTFEEFKQWYGGYHAADGTQLYNPWSVGNALMEGRLDLYWVASGTMLALWFGPSLLPLSGYDRVINSRVDCLLAKSSGFRDKIAKLVIGQAVSIEIDNDMSYHLLVAWCPLVISAEGCI